MGAKAVESLHSGVVSKRDHGMTGMVTDFSQGGINFYRCTQTLSSSRTVPLASILIFTCCVASSFSRGPSSSSPKMFPKKTRLDLAT